MLELDQIGKSTPIGERGGAIEHQPSQMADFLLSRTENWRRTASSVWPAVFLLDIAPRGSALRISA